MESSLGLFEASFCNLLLTMGLLDKLWDDVVAGPQPEKGLKKLREERLDAGLPVVFPVGTSRICCPSFSSNLALELGFLSCKVEGMLTLCGSRCVRVRGARAL